MALNSAVWRGVIQDTWALFSSGTSELITAMSHRRRLSFQKLRQRILRRLFQVRGGDPPRAALHAGAGVLALFRQSERGARLTRPGVRTVSQGRGRLAGVGAATGDWRLRLSAAPVYIHRPRDPSRRRHFRRRRQGGGRRGGGCWTAGALRSDIYFCKVREFRPRGGGRRLVDLRAGAVALLLIRAAVVPRRTTQ